MDNQFPPCPDSPNCVSSLARDERHYVKPFICKVDPETCLKQLHSILSSVKGFSVTIHRGNYLHVECKSRMFGFIDDLEFQWDGKSDVINVRSASRTGYYDFGVNRRRVEKIRQLITQ